MVPLLTPPDAVAPPPPAAGTWTRRGCTAAASDRGDEDDGKEETHVPPLDMARLPEDLIADILGRLRPRWLAASRCVCKAWRDAVDGRGLLRADLLPLSLAGFFVHYENHKFPELFSRPATASSTTGAPAPTGDLSFLCPNDPSQYEFGGIIYSDGSTQHNIEGHCNGLLLLRDCVFNPATRRRNPLPPHPHKKVRWHRALYSEYLVFDPTVSPHYEVFMIPHPDHNDWDYSSVAEASEFPPSPFKIHVFSSRSGSWEERSFVREGDPAMMWRCWADSTAVYWRGALYVHCKYNFVTRISLSDNTYRVIKPPTDNRGDENYLVHLDLVKSEKGVYYASFDKCWLRVWVLDESCGRTEWILKHDKDLRPVLAQRRLNRLAPGRWTLEDINYKLFLSSRFPEDDDTKQTTAKEESEWDSDDDDNALDNGDMFEEYLWDDTKHYDRAFWFQMLGFHPYKEIAFLTKVMEVGLAYHLNSSKVECLGSMYPTRYHDFQDLANDCGWIKCWFPYTPCRIEEFPGNN